MKRLRLLALAALVVLPLAACDEGTTVAPAVTGTVTGTVTIDGQGTQGITVTLSSGATTTTDASGHYTFSDVAAGAYTVALSGTPADATFDALAKAAVIATAGQVVTVDFAGSSVRTSAIIGSVSSGGQPLSGVTVALSGASSGSTTTDANGQYSFGGLKAGSYTLTVSGLPSGTSCSNSPASATLATGETKVVSFSCSATGNASITGRLFLDENDKNNVFDGAALEENLKAANVAINIEGPTIGTVQTVQTDANGEFSVTDLTPGTYNVCLADVNDSDIPSTVAFGGTTTCTTVEVAAGTTSTVNFPFDIVGEVLDVYAFLGQDSVAPGIAPVKGVILDLYPTEADALASTNKLGRDTTDADGLAQFTFDRTDDTAPGAGTDHIVFAQFVSAPTYHVLNGESRIEIHYDPRKVEDMAPDTFDLLNTELHFGFNAVAVNGDPLEGWNAAYYLNDTSTAATAVQTDTTDSNGWVEFRDAVAVGNLPDTFWVRLSGSQPKANSKAFTQTPEAQDGDAVGRWLRIIHDGTVPASDTLDLGNEMVKFLSADLLVRVYHEADDTAWMTGGDDFANVDNIRVTLWRNGDSVQTKTPLVSDGSVTFTEPEHRLQLHGDGGFGAAEPAGDHHGQVRGGAGARWQQPGHLPVPARRRHPRHRGLLRYVGVQVQQRLHHGPGEVGGFHRRRGCERSRPGDRPEPEAVAHGYDRHVRFQRHVHADGHA